METEFIKYYRSHEKNWLSANDQTKQISCLRMTYIQYTGRRFMLPCGQVFSAQDDDITSTVGSGEPLLEIDGGLLKHSKKKKIIIKRSCPLPESQLPMRAPIIIAENQAGVGEAANNMESHIEIRHKIHNTQRLWRPTPSTGRLDIPAANLSAT